MSSSANFLCSSFLRSCYSILCLRISICSSLILLALSAFASSLRLLSSLLLSILVYKESTFFLASASMKSRSNNSRKKTGKVGCGLDFQRSVIVTLSFDKSSFSVSTS